MCVCERDIVIIACCVYINFMARPFHGQSLYNCSSKHSALWNDFTSAGFTALKGQSTKGHADKTEKYMQQAMDSHDDFLTLQKKET